MCFFCETRRILPGAVDKNLSKHGGQAFAGSIAAVIKAFVIVAYMRGRINRGEASEALLLDPEIVRDGASMKARHGEVADVCAWPAGGETGRPAASMATC